MFSKPITWLLRLVPAIIMLQTLFFKFSGAQESIYIFTQVGIEPWGRIGTGVAELIASLLILYPRTTLYGAILAIGIMVGAIVSHLVILGIVIHDDGGKIFLMALATFFSAILLVYNEREKLYSFLNRN